MGPEKKSLGNAALGHLAPTRRPPVEREYIASTFFFQFLRITNLNSHIDVMDVDLSPHVLADSLLAEELLQKLGAVL